ncbi:MAG: large-conductance mechanosensitive channel protein MscL [Cytophagales bacterium]|nr:large-conductance mechanosensitive channel protein MscL [Cytophagales bacterium]MDW8384172.1 large-conductance mechanosensitive channel protein MscL [Flammeovirgaceae bacterium]
MIEEFKQFLLRGNVFDLAVGVVIGSAFGKIISSLVSDILMPPIGLLLSGINFKDAKFIIQEANPSENKVEVAIGYGNFIQILIEFVIIAFVIFLLIKAINRLFRKEASKPAELPTPSKEEILLTEIRDLLAKRS